VLSFVVLLSGTLAVLGDEIDWLLDGDRRIEAFEGRPAWSAMHAATRERFPDLELQSLDLGELPTIAAQARVRLPDGRPHRLFLDPATGEVLGEGHWLSAQRLLRDFHRYLFMLPSGLGLPIVTIVALVLAVPLVTGLMTVRKWARGLVTVRSQRGLRVFLGDLHRSAGLWSNWFTALMVVTSFWYFAEWMLHSSGGRAAAPMAAVSAPAGPGTGWYATGRRGSPLMRRTPGCWRCSGRSHSPRSNTLPTSRTRGSSVTWAASLRSCSGSPSAPSLPGCPPRVSG